MKNLVFYFVILLIICQSCKNKDTATPSPAPITGQWQWIQTYLDYPPDSMNPLTPANTGKVEILVFNVDNTWSQNITDSFTKSGTYNIGHGVYTNSYGENFSYDSVRYLVNNVPLLGMDNYYQIVHDTLVMTPPLGIVGGGSKFYIKK